MKIKSIKKQKPGGCYTFLILFATLSNAIFSKSLRKNSSKLGFFALFLQEYKYFF